MHWTVALAALPGCVPQARLNPTRDTHGDHDACPDDNTHVGSACGDADADRADAHAYTTDDDADPHTANHNPDAGIGDER